MIEESYKRRLQSLQDKNDPEKITREKNIFRSEVEKKENELKVALSLNRQFSSEINEHKKQKNQLELNIKELTRKLEEIKSGRREIDFFDKYVGGGLRISPEKNLNTSYGARFSIQNDPSVERTPLPENPFNLFKGNAFWNGDDITLVLLSYLENFEENFTAKPPPYEYFSGRKSDYIDKKFRFQKITQQNTKFQSL